MNRTHTFSSLSAICFALLFPSLLMMGQSPGSATPHRSSYDDPPPFKFQPWWEFRHPDHPYFGAKLAGLGDVNKDGGNDFAVSTWNDTTFIFFGGKALDDFPDAWVRGGGQQIVPGDFNGDGYIDLAVVPLHPMLWSYGQIMIYLNNKTPSVYNHDPDLTITGADISGDLGTVLLAGDLNRDGYTDLVASAPHMYIKDTTGQIISRGKIFLFLGKPVLDTIPDHVFYGVYRNRDDWIAAGIGQDAELAVGDINGDGYDDLVFTSGELHFDPNIRHYSLEIYYGNPRGEFGDRPDQELKNGFYFYFVGRAVEIAKMNGDAIQDLALPNDDLPKKDLSAVWGRSWGFYPPLPDEVFENPDSSFYAQGIRVVQVGDINGDGFDDYFVGWADRAGNGVIMEMYRGGKNWEHHAVAYYPILSSRDFFNPFPIPLHDIDGDGIDDFGLEQGSLAAPNGRYWDEVIMYRGTRSILAVSGVENIHLEMDFQLYPNPARDELTIRINRFEQSVDISIHDELGRTRKSIHGFSGQEARIDVRDLPSGVYIIVVMGRKGGVSTKKLIVSR
jgi:hypothetical protein